MENLFNFINNSISPFHAVVECEKLLKDAGFIRLFENKTYNLENGHGYYVVRNDASIIAFVMPIAATTPRHTSLFVKVSIISPVCKNYLSVRLVYIILF